MKNNLFKILFGIIIVAIVILLLIFLPKRNVKQNDNLLAIVPSETKSETVPKVTKNTNTQNAQSDRVPSRFACVGEYCDGSMESDNYLEKYTVLKIPLITDGGNLGCGAKLFFAPHAVPKTTAVLDATYKLLFDIKPAPEIAADGFRNVVGNYTKLWYDHVIVSNGVARLYLTGTMYGPGHCAEPELRAQIEQVALQFDTVQKLEVYLNGKIFDWCSMSDADPSESGCDKNPKYWIDSK
jgi:hypothetical protein